MSKPWRDGNETAPEDGSVYDPCMRLLLSAAIPLLLLGCGSSTTDATTDTQGNQPSGASAAVFYVTLLLSLGINIWNRWFKQGTTGQSIGKQVLGLKLLREADGQPIGPLMAFVRDICHILDGFCFIGYLFPLWDAKRQTLADKIMTTVCVPL